jgi:asparagine synthase (glutamine-hydrolysing)
VIDRLRGMFAIALIDTVEGSLLLARDPFAKKPLFMARVAGGLVFGSELRAVLLHPSVSSRLDRRSIARYFAWDYVPAPRTIYEDIDKLPGGHLAVYDLRSDTLASRPYWRFGIKPQARPSGSVDDWAVEMRRLLRASVEKRLQSDVPLGFFLSGGVDSSSIVALARDIVGDLPLKTFAIGFTEPSYDESAAARRVARLCRTEHHVKVLDIAAAVDLVPRFLRMVHEPVADDAIVPTYLLSGMAREHVTVALAGDGGDEMFAGYDTFGVLGLAQTYHRLVPKWLHRIVRAVADRMPMSSRRLALDFKMRRALRGLSEEPAYWNPLWIGAMGLEDLSALTRERQTAETVFADAAALWHGGASPHPVDRSIEFLARFYLQEDLMPKVDSASMLCSLEVRAPFLDRDLADFCATLPHDVKIRGGVRKWLLKKAMAPYLPDDILHRPKQGFSVPLIDWLRALPGPDLGLAEDIGLDAGWLARAHGDHVAGRVDHRGLLFAWHCLEGSVKGNADAVRKARAA